MWLSLQAAYDKDLVAIADRDNQEKEATSIENVLAGVQNIKLLFKRLGLDSYTFAKDRIKALYKTFNVSNIDEIISLAAPTGRFKKVRNWLQMIKISTLGFCWLIVNVL